MANTFRAGLLASLATLLASNVARADDWPSRGLAPDNQRASAEKIGGTFGAGRWAFQLPPGTATVATPAVADGHVVFGAFDGILRAIGEVDGQLRWQLVLGDGVYATPVIDRGRVFVPALDRQLHAISLRDGKTIWTKDLGGLAMGSPVLHEGALVVAAGFPHRSVWKIDAATGETLWKTSDDILAQFSNSSAAVSGDQVVIGANEGHYYSFDWKTGALRWTYQAEGIVNLAAPVIVDGRAFIFPGGRSNLMHAVELATGKAAPGWPIELSTSASDVEGVVLGRDHAVSSLAAMDGRIVFDLRIDDALDTNGDGEPNRFLMRESVMAVDAASGKIVWRKDNGRLVSSDGTAVPKFWLCPTPALWKTSSEGTALVAAASTLTAAVRVLDLQTGAEVSQVTTAGPAQISPVVANGRLFVGAHRTVEGLLSSVNQPPLAPALAALDKDEITKDAVTLRWAQARDDQGDAIRYQLRVDRDGEVLRTWASEVSTEVGTGGVVLTGPFEINVAYSYAIRARDAAGAWSDWSKIGTFLIEPPAAPPEPSKPEPRLPEAFTTLLNARSGDVVTLGAGNFTLGQTVRIPAGVTLRGAGAGRTILHGTGLAKAVVLEGKDGNHPTRLSHVTITGAGVAVAIENNDNALLTNVILRDNSEAGIEVGAGAKAQLINGTLLRTGNAVISSGEILVKNTLVSESRVAFWSQGPSAITSRFNNLWGNELDYRNAEPGLGDMGAQVAWVDHVGRDLHLQPEQASTDRGDPTDDFSAEPLPNGGRINLGAFGGTDEAEPSPAAKTTPPTRVAERGGGGCAVAPSSAASDTGLGLLGLFVAGVLLRTRRRRPRDIR
ncbi:MAG TPA: PQQ-binding-like beta-propeller repeat protein [Polyangia bacterium]